MLWNIFSISSFYVALFLGCCTFAISVQNPVHAILILIAAFILGSLLLTIFSLDYFAILFLVVYVGAIVVLFLFIVMMLELKMVNLSERFSDLFNYRNLFLPALLALILLLEQGDLFNGVPSLYNVYVSKYNQYPILVESNLYVDYSKILIQTDVLSALGMSLFRYEMTGIILAAILLFVSMVGSIVLTMDTKVIHTLKMQIANLQALRSSISAVKSWRNSFFNI